MPIESLQTNTFTFTQAIAKISVMRLLLQSRLFNSALSQSLLRWSFRRGALVISCRRLILKSLGFKLSSRSSLFC